MKVRPLHDRIVVQRLEEGEQRIGGIIIPDTAKEKPQQGKVIAAGSGKAGDEGKRVPLDVKAGDKILFGRYAGQEVKLDGEEYLIMKEDDVLAVIEGETPKKPVVTGKLENKGKTKTTKKIAKISKVITKSKITKKGNKGKKGKKGKKVKSVKKGNKKKA
jgi:chaperonin GroES